MLTIPLWYMPTESWCVLFLMLDWICVLINTATMMPCRRVSEMEVTIRELD